MGSRQRARRLGWSACALAVGWIAGASFAGAATNTSLDAARITQLKNAGLTGSGIITGQIEGYQPDPTHPLISASIVGQNNNPDLLNDDHSAQVAGIMIGGTNGGQQGIASGASHYTTAWSPGNTAGFISGVDYLVGAPVAQVSNMSSGDVLGNRNLTLSTIADWAVNTHNMLFVIADTNDGWDSNTNAPRPNSTGNPDGGYNMLSVGALGMGMISGVTARTPERASEMTQRIG